MHAVLLYGADGSGKDELASILVESWLCRNAGPSGADGTCQACAAFRRGSNPDYLDIQPQGASRNIRLRAISRTIPAEPDDPTPLRDFFRTPPMMSRHKVAVIHSADRMNDDASDSLLKSLEEPHPFAKIVLTTDSIGTVKDTIRSRCLAIACQLPSREELREFDPSATDEDLALAAGAPGRVRTVLEHPEAYRRIGSFARSLGSRHSDEAIKVAEEFRSAAEALEKATGSGARTANAEALNLLATLLSRDPNARPQWTQDVVEAHRRIVGNGNPGLVFDALFTRMLRHR
ncbi:MAG TPA: hypothetical protein VGE01_11500 [Fimbriimonas sp.]